MYPGERDDKDKGRADKESKCWDEIYCSIPLSCLYDIDGGPSFLSQYERRMLQPLHMGGTTRGDAYGSAIHYVLRLIEERARKGEKITILDVGSGFGDLTAYLALKSPNATVIGIDVSSNAKKAGETLAQRLAIRNCHFLTESISKTSFLAESVDLIIGIGTFHHFIKEKEAAGEIVRILKKNGIGVFIDSFHENCLFRIFHDREAMKKLGDEIMTRRKIRAFWAPENLDVELIPKDWMVMFDKLISYCRHRFFKKEDVTKAQAAISKVLFSVDRMVEHLPRAVTAYFAGAVITIIRPKN